MCSCLGWPVQATVQILASIHFANEDIACDAVGLGLLIVQALACGFFPGSNRGFNLPFSAVSFTSWSYRGLLQNEFLYRGPRIWGCPGQTAAEVTQVYLLILSGAIVSQLQASVQLSDREGLVCLAAILPAIRFKALNWALQITLSYLSSDFGDKKWGQLASTVCL